MSADDAEFGVSLGKWFGVVRRARLDLKKKSVALVVGSYASTDGTSVKCGVARLAADCQMGFSTARRYLAWLREVGLIELVKVGNRKSKRSDEYRLTVHPHTEKAINALAEDEYRDLVDGMKATNRSGEKSRRLSALTQEVSAEATDSEGPDEEPSALTQRTERRSGFLRSPMGEPPPKDKRSPLTGGAPPPGPRRPHSPSARGTDEQKSPSEPLTPAQDQQGDSLPHARGAPPGEHLGTIVDFFTREAM
jgi:hypothetical protein